MPESPSPAPATQPTTLLNQPVETQPTSTGTQPTPTPSPTAPTNDQQGQSPLSAASAQTPPAVPDSYTFVAPEGKTLDAAAIAAFTPIAKDLGLTQAAADRLFAFYNERTAEVNKTIDSAIQAMGEKWMMETRADPNLGPRIDAIKQNTGRMFDVVFAKAPEVRAAFQKAMNDTMSGNNPAFIRAFDMIASHVNEGSYVSGAGPASTGQNPTGQHQRPSLAQAMYGHLSSNN